MALGLVELNPGNSTELEVRITAGDGQQLTRWITNETVGVSFDVEAGNEYFIAVSAGEDQAGSYELAMTLEADVVEAEVAEQETADAEVDAEVEDATEEILNEDPVVENGDVEVVVTEDVDEAVVAGSERETEPEVADEMCDDEEVVDAGAETGSEVDVEPVSIDQIPVEIVGSVAGIPDTDTVDDIPESFEPEVNLADEATEDDGPVVEIVDDSTDVDMPIDDLVDEGPAVDFDPIDEFVDEEMEICFSDLDGEIDFVDSFFAEFDPSSIFTMNDGYELRLRN